MGDPKSTGRKAKTSPSRRSRRSKSTSRRVLFAQSTKRFRTTLSSISSILPLFLRILKLKWRKIFVHSLRLTSKLATTSGRASFHVRFSTSLVKLSWMMSTTRRKKKRVGKKMKRVKRKKKIPTSIPRNALRPLEGPQKGGRRIRLNVNSNEERS